jgi:streptogramin lyase
MGGNSAAGANANIGLMAALGPCSGLSSISSVAVNEITTVGSVWALSPFMSSPLDIGASATNATGLANAFADVNTLINIQTGVAPGPGLPSGATAPVSEINALGNILRACINSTGGVAGDGSACGNLFKYANTGTAPTDTVTAAMNIAQHPGLNTASLFALNSASAPFQPSLTSAPNDFTIAVSYAAGGLSTPSALAVDQSGNVWVANKTGNTVTEMSHTGALLSGTSGYAASLNAPSAIAIDTSGGAWIVNQGNNTVSRISSSGGVVSGTPYTGISLTSPTGIAFDNSGNAWISNATSVSEVTSAGVLVKNYTASGVTAGVGIGVDSQ